MLKKQKKITKIDKISKYTEILFIASSVLLAVVIISMGIVPTKYLLVLLGVLATFCFLFGLIAFLKGVNSFNKVIQTVLCSILSILLIISSIGIEMYKEKIRNIFVNTETITLYVYVLKDSPIENVDQLGNKTAGLSSLTNEEVQKNALFDLKSYLNKYELGDITTTTYHGVSQIIDALYNHEVDCIMIQSNLVSFITELEAYEDFTDKVRTVYESTHKITIKGSDANFKIKNITKDPFVVAIGGTDYNGHYDVNMVVTVNPLTKQVLVVTVPRDAYSPLDGDPEKMDKLTYSGKLGTSVWLKTFQLFFDYNFNYHCIVDFFSIADVIDALGGIDIYNPYYFSSGSFLERGKRYYFYEGDIHLTGSAALSYCRERQSLDEGDLSRNEHQGIVLRAMIKKLTSSEIVNNADNVLDALKEKIATDFKPETIYKLVNMQLSDNAEWNIVTYNVKGTLFYTYSYMIGHEYGPNYAMMDLDKDSLKEANNLMKKVLDGELLNN